MPDQTPQPVKRLADYRPWPFGLTETRLDVTLAPRGTVVRSELDLRPGATPEDLVLDGGAGLRLKTLEIDGRPVEPAQMRRDDETLTIAADALPHLFDPFFTTKPVGDGLGLGLAVSYAIVRELDGDLQAVNRPEGGARFTLRLPAATAPQELP